MRTDLTPPTPKTAPGGDVLRRLAPVLFHAGAAGVTLAFALAAWLSRQAALDVAGYLALIGLAWMGFALAWGACRSGFNGRVSSILIWAVIVRVAAFASAPLLEDDPWRYLWDGYQTSAWGHPYDRAPAESFQDPEVPVVMQRVLDRVNHPDLPTVYGPTAQLAFFVCHQLSPGALWPWKLMLAAADVFVLLQLLRLKHPGAGAFWAFCPLILQCTFASAHLDGLAVGLTVAAGALAPRSHPTARHGWWLALAVGTRPHALLLSPWLLRRSRAAWLHFSIGTVLLHAPVLLGGGWPLDPDVATRLGAWEFNPSVYAWFAACMDPHHARWIMAGIFVLIWGLLVRRLLGTKGRNPVAQTPAPPGDVLFGALWLLSPVVNPWYLLWMAPYVALRPAAWSVVALAAVALSYVTGLRTGDASLGAFGHPGWVRPVEYGLIAAAGVWDVLRWRQARRVHPPGPMRSIPDSSPSAPGDVRTRG